MAAPLPSTTSATGADLVVSVLEELGVRTCFANPGTTEMWLVGALEKTKGTRSVLGLHETVCSGAADGFSRMSQAVPWTLLHLGPGLANALANLHNARRAGSPLLNIIGDMATWHRGADAPLSMDIEALAHSVSCFVRTCKGVDSLRDDVIDAVAAALRTDALPGESRVATLILPHDVQWSAAPPPPSARSSAVDLLLARGAALAPQQEALSAGVGSLALLDQSGVALPPSSSSPVLPHPPRRRPSGVLLSDATRAFVSDCAEALRQCPPGKACVFLGGRALLSGGGAGEEDDGTSDAGAAPPRPPPIQGPPQPPPPLPPSPYPGALFAAGRVAAAVSAALLCQNGFARADRGAGRPPLVRVPYFPKDARKEFSKYDLVVCADAPRPVAMFGYREGEEQGSALLPHPEGSVWDFDQCADMSALSAALNLLADELGAPAWSSSLVPAVCAANGHPGNPPQPPQLPRVPSGSRLTPALLCATVAALQPPGCIVVDESLTSGGEYWAMSAGAAPFTHLALTGGAIGQGPPLAVGAAVACPRRRVINLQADGSGLYSAQALWTQARERLGVVTVVCANRKYQILKLELALQGVGVSGPTARRLTDLGDPSVDWVRLAEAFGVPASRAATAGELAEQLREALRRAGPSLIEAVLP